MRFPVTIRPLLLVAIFLGFLAVKAAATTYYVDVNSANPTPPYTSWATASTDIQSAIDVSTNGDLVLVNPGVYNTGGETVNGYALTNRVVIDQVATVESVNGPAATMIEGNQDSNPNNDVRCISLVAGANLIGFTLTNGATMQSVQTNYNDNGGGAWCQSTNASLSNCVVIANECYGAGGGVYGGTLYDCQIVNNTGMNSESSGCGAAYSTLFNSAILANGFHNGTGQYGSGAIFCTLSNSIVSGNSRGGVAYCTLEDCTIENNTNTSYDGGGAMQSTLYDCLVSGNQGAGTGGAFDCVLNFCLISNNLGSGVEYDSQQTSAPGQSNVVIGNISGSVGGGVGLGANVVLNNWTIISNSAASDGGGVYVSPVDGEYFGSLSNCTIMGNISGGNGGGCYGSSSASFAPIVSSCIFLNNMAKGGGGGAYFATLTNCWLIGNTAGRGGGAYGVTYSCVMNSNVATNGGGLYGYDPGVPPLIANCTFTNNSALNGGGAFQDNSGGSLLLIFSNCVFWANTATNNAGGIALNGGEMEGCIVGDNHAGVDGGGVYDAGLIWDCLLYSNSAAYGGGSYFDYASSSTYTSMVGSTIADNRATNNGGGICYGGLSYRLVDATNCIIYDNYALTNMNYSPTNILNSQNIVSPPSANYCCTMPLPVGAPGRSDSNFTNDPAFVNSAGGDFHLQSSSPCINSGNNADIWGPTDLDGNPRIVGGTVDMGCYEYQTPTSMISYHWLQQYGLPTDGSVDFADLDGTPFNVYQDWVAGLNPTNAASVLMMLSPTVTSSTSAVTVSWESVSGIDYNVLRGTNLASGFTTIRSNVVGQAGTTSYTDTSATNGGPYFYRVSVQAP